jgi:hypothetical protein
MKKVLCLLILLAVSLNTAVAQDEEPEKKEKKPLSRDAFQSDLFMDNQTVWTPPSNTLEFILQHRFGTIENGISDLFGIWGATNIRIGLNYSITKDVVVGLGTTKNKRYQDLNLKYVFFRQRDHGFPLTIGYYGVYAIDASDKSNFGKDYVFIDRFSFYHELMFARRFCSRFSMQLGVNFSHYNKVDSTLKNDVFGLSGLARIKATPQTSVVISFQYPFMLGYDEPFILKYGQTGVYWGPNRPLPNVGLGVEICTSTHAFHIFLSAAQGIIPQEIATFNRNDILDGQIILGFNMTRLWTF